MSRARQLILFDEMNIEKRSFTDFDAVMEWRDFAWLVFEVKHGNKGVPVGQRIALERFVMDARKAGKRALAAVVEHYEDDASKGIYLKDCKTRSLFVSSELRWRPPKRPMTAKELMHEYIRHIETTQTGRFC